MQTFLPYRDYEQSAYVLDDRRLGKQRVETLQILRSNLLGTGWVNHPATKMWKGYSTELTLYGYAICEEWINRGFRDTCLGKIQRIYYAFEEEEVETPPWMGDERLHKSHQSNLLAKYPEHYSRFFPGIPNDLPYYWPR